MANVDQIQHELRDVNEQMRQRQRGLDDVQERTRRMIARPPEIDINTNICSSFIFKSIVKYPMQGSVVATIAVITFCLLIAVSFPSSFDRDGNGKVNMNDVQKCLDMNNDGKISVSESLGGGGLCIWCFVLLLCIVYSVLSIAAIMYIGSDVCSTIENIDNVVFSRVTKSNIEDAWVSHGCRVLLLIALLTGSIVMGGYRYQAESIDIDQDGDVDMNDLFKIFAVLFFSFLVMGWLFMKIVETKRLQNEGSVEEWNEGKVQ